MHRLTFFVALGLWNMPLFAADHPRPDQAPEVRYDGEGTINRVEPIIGLINITHGPVPTVGWSARTQDLRMRPKNLAGGLRSGMRIRFQISSPDPLTHVITAVEPVD